MNKFDKFTEDMQELEALGEDMISFVKKDAGDKKLRVSINLGSKTFGEESFLASIKRAYYSLEDDKIYAEFEIDK